jgi:hypothetical protein
VKQKFPHTYFAKSRRRSCITNCILYIIDGWKNDLNNRSLKHRPPMFCMLSLSWGHFKQNSLQRQAQRPWMLTRVQR